MIKKMILAVLGKYKPSEEIHLLKNEIAVESLKTQVKAKQVNKLLYNKDTTYFLAKAMGVI